MKFITIKYNTMKHTKMYSILMALFISGIYWQAGAQVQNADVHEFPGFKQMKLMSYRYNINIPDIDGYQTLKCDFHMHTIFSDGQVLPTMRVIEAWNDGLDAIAITDHVERQRYEDIVKIDLNKSGLMAQKMGNEIGMLVIRGAEVTRKKPLGHINALFVQDVEKLKVENELDAINEAVKQGAYLQWNHPGWPNDTSTFYPVHKELITQKKIRGVEVFNGSELYPKVLDWCDENQLAYLANTDLHYASANSYREKLQRPMTLVFTKERTEEGIREALFAGRTLAYFYNHLAGKEEFLKQIVLKSLLVKVINAEKGTIEISNRSDINYDIRFNDYMYSVPVYANQTLRIDIPSGTNVTFTNCLIRQDKQLVMKLW